MEGRSAMIKVKSFTSEIKYFQAMRELNQIDEQVNHFLTEQRIKKVISVSDCCTTDNSGSTIGLIRVICYEG
jgi:hypothetical protein